MNTHNYTAALAAVVEDAPLWVKDRVQANIMKLISLTDVQFKSVYYKTLEDMEAEVTPNMDSRFINLLITKAALEQRQQKII